MAKLIYVKKREQQRVAELGGVLLEDGNTWVPLLEMRWGNSSGWVGGEEFS